MQLFFLSRKPFPTRFSEMFLKEEERKAKTVKAFKG
jgi:hypothetical protein